MRMILVALALVSLCGCDIDRDGAVPATIAHFDRGGQKDGLLVYIATRSDEAKLELGQHALLRRGKIDFVIGPDMHREGNKMVRERAAVARGDFLTVLQEQQDARARAYVDTMARIGIAPREPDPLPEIVVIEKGEELVAGQSGTLYRIARKDAEDSDYIEVVVSTDEKLAPVGRLFAMMLAPEDAIPSDIWGRPNPMIDALSHVIAKGTVLRFAALKPGRAVPDDLYRLSFVEESWTDPARFNLPVRTYDLEGLRSNTGKGTLFQGSEGFNRGAAI